MIDVAMSPTLATIDLYGHRGSCPCCHEPSERSRTVVASEPRAETLEFEAHGRFLSGYGARRVFFSYHRCPRCKLLYCPTYYTPEQLAALYSRQAENMADVPLHSRCRTQAKYLDLVPASHIPAGDYLEIGADIGLFAEQSARRFVFDNFWLFEPNQEVRLELEERLRGKPKHIEHCPFVGTAVPESHVALAVAIHVLDHVLEPEQLLANLARTLTDRGMLLAVTHDERSLLARMLGRRWPPYTLQHPQLYSSSTLCSVIQQAGLRIISVSKTTNYFPLFHLVRAGLGILGLDGRAIADWQGPEIGLQLGNIAVVAQKC